jgi:hypothetical protein
MCLATPRHRPRWPTPRHRALHAPLGAAAFGIATLASLRSPQRGVQRKAKAFYRTEFTPPGETPLGFMNIEFHNKLLFSDETQMLDFVEKEILAFKYLIEYQFLKKRFFSVVSQQFITEPT